MLGWLRRRQCYGGSISSYPSVGRRSSKLFSLKGLSAGMQPGVLFCGFSVSVGPPDTNVNPKWLLHSFINERSPFAVLLFFPETKELTLEELDAVFSVATHRQMARGFKEPGYWINKSILGRDVDLPPLVDIDELRDT